MHSSSARDFGSPTPATRSIVIASGKKSASAQSLSLSSRSPKHTTPATQSRDAEIFFTPLSPSSPNLSHSQSQTESRTNLQRKLFLDLKDLSSPHPSEPFTANSPQSSKGKYTSVAFESPLSSSFFATPRSALLSPSGRRNSISNIEGVLKETTKSPFSFATKQLATKPPERNTIQENIDLLTQALERSNQNLKSCHQALKDAVENEARMRDFYENLLSIQKECRKRDTNYWRSRVLQSKKATESEAIRGMEEVCHSQQQQIDALSEEVTQLRHELQRAHDTNRESERKRLRLEQELSDANNQLQQKDKNLERANATIKALKATQEAETRKIRSLSIQQVVHMSKEIRGFKTELNVIRDYISATPEILGDMLSRINHVVENMPPPPEGLTKDPYEEIRELRGQVKKFQDMYIHEFQARRRLQNTLQELKGNIRVYCRVRPFLETDGTPRQKVVRVVGEETVEFQPSKGKAKVYELDQIFDMDASQEDVFKDIEALIPSVLDGYNVLIMAYGQTGSGKTYTMQGPPSLPGIIPRSLDELFKLIELHSRDCNYEVEVSVLEIYNNEIRDLLLSKSAAEAKCDLRSNQQGLTAPSASQIRVHSAADVRRYISIAATRRAEGCTSLNEHSSRSHCIVTLTVKGHNSITGTRTTAKLSLADLAGSECVGQSNVTGDALREASYINRSLSALSDVLDAISKKAQHIPYRNSKLTHFLQDSLGGDAKMTLIVNIAPSARFSSESMHALYFGQRARQVTRGAATKHITTDESPVNSPKPPSRFSS